MVSCLLNKSAVKGDLFQLSMILLNTYTSTSVSMF